MSYYLTKRDPEKNQRRFYGLHLAPTLFGGWSVVREWGRIGATGTVRVDFFDAEDEALQSMEDLKGKKIKRGYE